MNICCSRPAGGFKLWEGALDLCQYLIQRYGLQHLCRDSSSSSAAAAGGEASSSGSSSLQGKAVIELGCGHGLPGIVAALGGASKVHFQVSAGGSCGCDMARSQSHHSSPALSPPGPMLQAGQAHPAVRSHTPSRALLPGLLHCYQP